MRVPINKVKRLGTFGMTVVLGVSLLGILVAGSNAPRTRANSAKTSPVAATKLPNAARGALPRVQAPACVTPPAGMVSWWPGDGNATDLQDGNNGTLVGGTTFAPGKVAQAFSFDGVGDWVNVPDADNLDIPTQITIDAWINPTALGGRIVDKMTPGEPDGYLLDILGGKLRFVFGGQEVIGNTTLTTGTFTHVAGTYDFTTLRVFVNGVEDGNLPMEEVSAAPNDLPLRIGADQTGATTFTGLIDEVEIFDRALGESEILSIVTADSAGKCKGECVLTCPANISQDNDIGQCGAVVTFAPTSSVCGTVTCAPASGSFFPKGTTGVTCTAAGGTTCSFNITVNDTEPPAMICPDITKPTDPGQCTAVVTYASVATDNCPGVTSMCTPPSGSTFPLGPTTVNCTATDTSNNTSECSFTVTVQDTKPPTLTPCPMNMSVINQGGCQVVNYTPPTATDDCGSATVSCAPPSGFCFPQGTTTVTCTASDDSPDSPDAMCSFTVTVAQCAASCPSNIVVNNTPGRCDATVTFSATAPAGCGGVICNPASGSIFPVGTTTVTCTPGQGPSCTFTVKVNDVQPPTITCPPNIVTAASNGCPLAASAPVSFSVTASDNCSVQSVVCKNQNNQVVTSGSPFPVGTSTVTCTATDASGNTATCSFSVTVFSGCVQDDSDPSRVVLFNAQTGQYRFCCGGTVYTGTGTVTVKGCLVTIQHNTTERRVQISTDGNTGNASLQSPPGTTRCTIQDRNVRNNSCVCQ